ncbi:hypothetical protein CAI21_21345 [Alkalilimnicola ehrlichii]|uniref:Methyl-accepting chemotaxis sensory transducer n=1 Tax=Alkalilimnicola ehrlichii TaxID=351052 RepID=A0A3E0WJU1_9GAMM|nr:methyl-accepting chemotaxis protein [Alkalilimnicola ehrlichii]RFA24490.1 hypothetical protein CAI21_21345 [Alkalilimnicola ehrlichii]RFA32155.1 hypothetical protein CAL65_20225 [Alkalilimnicola ehrlichii]
MSQLKALIAKLSIMHKALIGPVVMLLFMILTGVVAIASLNTLDNRMNLVATDLTPNTGLATDMMRTIFQERLATDTFIADNSLDNYERWQQRNEASLQVLRQAKESFQNSERMLMVDEVESLHFGFTQQFGEEVAPRRLEIGEIRDGPMETHGTRVDGRITNIMELAYNQHFADSGDLAAEIVRDILRARLEIETFLRTAREEDEQSARVILDRVTGNIDLLEILSYDDTSQQEAQAALEDWNMYIEAFDRAAELTHEAQRAIEEGVYALGPYMTDSAQDLQQHIFAELDQLALATSDDTARSLTIMVAVILFAGAFGLALAFIVTRGVISPLLATNRQIDKMLKDIESGHGDLTYRLPVKSGDEVGQLTANFNRFVETLQGVVRNIGDEANQLASAAEELSAVTSQTNAGVQRQNQETDQAATAINEMTATVQEIARNAAEASAAAQDANASAGEGRRVVAATVEAIDQLAQMLEHGRVTIDKLGSDAESITTIIDVIQDVAEQTNLLALNAAIEAARAGEQGRGFAVVADEVRDLAQKTQSSTHKIQELIETLQTGARSAVDAMANGGEQSQRTVQYAAEAGTSLEAITHKVSQINDMNAQIASAAEEQTAVSNDISQSVTRIRDIAVETAGGSKQTATSSEELARLSERLSKLVGQFRV